MEGSLQTGDVIAFTNNKILVKRVIATSGEWVDITDDGTVYVNNIEIEPRPKNHSVNGSGVSVGSESRLFVLGIRTYPLIRGAGHGCVAEEQIVGKISSSYADKYGKSTDPNHISESATNPSKLGERI